MKIDVETCRGTQHENGDGSGDGNESSSGISNWNKVGNGDGNEDGIREGRGEKNERKKPHKTCRRDQPFSFSTRHHLCRQGVVLAHTRQLRSQGPVPIHAHRTKGVTGCVGQEDENRVRDGIRVGGGNGHGNRVRGGNGNGNVDGEEDRAGTNTGVEANERT